MRGQLFRTFGSRFHAKTSRETASKRCKSLGTYFPSHNQPPSYFHDHQRPRKAWAPKLRAFNHIFECPPSPTWFDSNEIGRQQQRCDFAGGVPSQEKKISAPHVEISRQKLGRFLTTIQSHNWGVFPSTYKNSCVRILDSGGLGVSHDKSLARTRAGAASKRAHSHHQLSKATLSEKQRSRPP